MNAARNITLNERGQYKVMVFRHRAAHWGGTHRSLAAATAARDALEVALPKRPSGRQPGGKPKRGMVVLFKERREAGLCVKCGDEPPKPGRACCQGCITAMMIYKRHRREQRSLLAA